MKLKSLIALMLVLLAALVAVACGDGDTDVTTTGAGQSEATTTAVSTTKATTTKQTTTAATTTVATTTQKREITFNIPAKLPDNKDYDATLIFDGTESDLTIAIQKQTDKGNSYDIFALPDGNKVFAYHIKGTWMEASVVIPEYRFNGEEDGFLFYADISQTKSGEHASLGPRLKIDTFWYQIGSHANSNEKAPDAVQSFGYYLADGATDWVKTENWSNCRLEVPAGFKGWIYMPFGETSLNGGSTPPFLDEYISAYPGECVLTEVEIYNGDIGPAEGAETGECYFDNFIIVTQK